jgi:phosphopantetheinyl transferase (holo-ACP synthase)
MEGRAVFSQDDPVWWRDADRIALTGMPGRVLLGAGVDLGDAARLGLAVRRSGDGLARRVLTAAEFAERGEFDAGARVGQLTTAFSVKESVVKVLGGMPRGGRYRDVAVGPPGPGGVRRIDLRGEFDRWATHRGARLVAGAVPLAPHLVLTWVLALVDSTDVGTTDVDRTEGDAR